MNEFFQRLKQRKLVQWAIAYVAAAFALLQGIDIIGQQFGWPDSVRRGITLALVVGLFVTLVLAWYHGERGVQRVTGTELLIIGLVLAVGGGLLWRFASTHAPDNKTSVVSNESGVSEPSRVIPEKSIAVLPFASLSEDKANAYFADGIQDEILTRLSKITQLKVISRTSTQQYQSKPGNLSEIARQLGVAHILEGSVQKSNDSVRVNVQLIKAEGDSHLWAETYDRKLTDIFAVESEVAQRIAGSLEARLTGREQQQLADVPTKDPHAYEAYLRGRTLLNVQGLDAIDSAIGFLRKAVELDPKYAEAWAQLAIAESQESGHERTPEQLELARHAAETAVRLQPESAETHTGLATFYYYALHDYDRALAELEEARRWSPNDANVIFYIGLIKRRQGKLDEAIEYQRKATVLDPRNSDIWVNLSGTYRGKRDFKTARATIDQALAISPDELDIVGYKAEIDIAEGNLDAADEILRGRKAVPGTEAFYLKIYALVCRRKFEEALAVFAGSDDTINPRPLSRARRNVFRGEVEYLAGHREESRRLMEQGRAELLALRAQGNTSQDLTQGLIGVYAFLDDREAFEHEADALLRAKAGDKWGLGSSEQEVAYGYAIIGDADRALPLIERGLSTECDSSLTTAMLRQDPIWDRIRNDPRFQKLCKEPNK